MIEPPSHLALALPRFVAYVALAAALAFGAPITAPAGEGGSGAWEEVFTGLSFDEILRLQIVLDRSLVAPGKVDGLSGRFTEEAALRWVARRFSKPAENLAPAEWKAGFWALLREARALEAATAAHAITEEDKLNVGPLPDSLVDRARLKALPYPSVAARLAERYHTDIRTLIRLNPGISMDTLGDGKSISVPAVAPFRFPEDVPAPALAAQQSSAEVYILVLHSSRILEVLDPGGLLLAAFPITVGDRPHHLRAGLWQMKSAVPHPSFRHDSLLLTTGVRGDACHILPPGPSNPVGVLWFGLAPIDSSVPAAAIGIHGTASAATIGRSASSGCIRLANWDVVRLAEFVGIDTKVRWEDR